MKRIALSLGLIAAACGSAVLLASCLGGTATATVTTACVSFDPQNAGDAFTIVSEVLERRCATLDCHGQASRPLRLYGSSGLRRPEPDDGTEGCQDNKECGGPGRVCKKGVGCIDASIYDYAQYYSGSASIATTPSERLENWEALCGLEPELFTVVYCCSVEKGRCGGEFDYATHCAKPDLFDVERLTIVRKARLREKHKGGLIWNKNDPGDACLTSWITGAYEKPDADTSACTNELQHL